MCVVCDYPNPSCWFVSVGASPLVAVSSSGGESFRSPRHGDCCSLACVEGGPLRACAGRRAGWKFHDRPCPRGGWDCFSVPCGGISRVRPVLDVCANSRFSGVQLVFGFGAWACLLENVCVSGPVTSAPVLAAGPSLTPAAVAPSPVRGCLPAGF